MGEKPNITRDGFIVEMVTEGCKCLPLSVMDKHYKGKDYWSDLTDGREKCTMSAYLDIEGVCPLCSKPVIYSEYLVVTETKEVSDAAV